MKYDFDTVIDRKNTDSVKYDYAAEDGCPQDVLPLWIADMDFRTAPPVTEALERRVRHGIFGYTRPGKDYFEAVVNWFRTRHGWEPAAESFVPSCSVVFALAALLRTVTKEGDAVLICPPVYYPFERTILQNRRRPVASELLLRGGRYEMDFSDFEKKIEENEVKAFILCSPHNPVGRVWTREELEQAAEICARHGVFVISDEIHADFVYEGHRHVPFATLQNAGARCAVCTAPTKTFNLAGLHIANICIPNEEVRAAYRRELDKLGYCHPGTIGMDAAKAAYLYGADWLDELLVYLKGNLALLRGFLKEELPELTLIEPEGTYLAWVDCRALHLTDKNLQALVEQRAHLRLDEGYIFGKSGGGFERINLACPARPFFPPFSASNRPSVEPRTAAAHAPSQRRKS